MGFQIWYIWHPDCTSSSARAQIVNPNVYETVGLPLFLTLIKNTELEEEGSDMNGYVVVPVGGSPFRNRVYGPRLVADDLNDDIPF